jgi:putative membrane protein
MAAGDSIVQQILGHGLAARLSARLGEGVINGILTARVGIAAIDVCRPLPFVTEKPPAMADFMAELAKLNAGKPPKRTEV